MKGSALSSSSHSQQKAALPEPGCDGGFSLPLSPCSQEDFCFLCANLGSSPYNIKYIKATVIVIWHRINKI